MGKLAEMISCAKQRSRGFGKGEYFHPPESSSVVRVRNGQWMCETTKYLDANLKSVRPYVYYDRRDFSNGVEVPVPKEKRIRKPRPTVFPWPNLVIGRQEAGIIRSAVEKSIVGVEGGGVAEIGVQEYVADNIRRAFISKLDELYPRQ